MERRKFIKGAGLLGSLVGGVVAGKVIVEKHYHETKYIAPPEPPKEDISHLAPVTTVNTLQLQADNSPPEVKEKMRITSSEFFITPASNPEYTNVVNMSVGKDNRLWIKVGEEWKRVVLEG
jgi:hypothetical protein